MYPAAVSVLPVVVEKYRPAAIFASRLRCAARRGNRRHAFPARAVLMSAAGTRSAGFPTIAWMFGSAALRVDARGAAAAAQPMELTSAGPFSYTHTTAETASNPTTSFVAVDRFVCGAMVCSMLRGIWVMTTQGAELAGALSQN